MVRLECAQLGYTPEIERGQTFCMGQRLGYACLPRGLNRNRELNMSPKWSFNFYVRQNDIGVSSSWGERGCSPALSSSVRRLVTKQKQTERAISHSAESRWILPTPVVLLAVTAMFARTVLPSALTGRLQTSYAVSPRMHLGVCCFLAQARSPCCLGLDQGASCAHLGPRKHCLLPRQVINYGCLFSLLYSLLFVPK